MSDTGTLAVVSDGGRRVVGVKVKVGGRRGSCMAWERGEVVEVGRWDGAEGVGWNGTSEHVNKLIIYFCLCCNSFHFVFCAILAS